MTNKKLTNFSEIYSILISIW